MEVYQWKIKFEQVQQQLQQLSGDKANLQDMLTKSTDQIQGLRKSLSSADSMLQDLQKSKDRCNELQNYIRQQDAQLNQYKELIAHHLAEIEKLKSAEIKIQGEKSMLEIEIRRYQEVQQKKKEECDDLRNKINGLEVKMVEYNQLMYTRLELEQ